MPIPDEKIYPHATGRAAETVAKHQDPQELVFYSGWVRDNESTENNTSRKF